MIIDIELIAPEKVAARIGLQYHQIRQALYNENPRVDVVERLAGYLGCTMEELMDSIRVYQRRRLRYGEDNLGMARDL